MTYDSNDSNIPTETLAETENYTIWSSEEPDGETTYHIELGPVTAHFFQEEWDEFLELIRDAIAQPIEDTGDEEAGAFDVELDWGALFFTQDEWNEFVRLIEQVEG
ncbi:MAG: hypothetical protein GXY36_13530 [Chloroflexi bacterium]|jgi:hypothetical protein|nr:hypothetical protein [Chloroflexota bacterium]